MKQIEVPESVYSAFLKKDLGIDELNNSNYFRMYVVAFADSADAKNLTKTKAYKKLSQTEQKQVYLNKLYEYIIQIEREKLFYFALVYRQTTVIIKAPADNKGQKEFLGYDWSNRKGNEGIQIITPGGKMYDDSNRDAEGTLACAIRDSFEDKVSSFSEKQKEYASVVQTKDMLDFSRVYFNKSISLAKKETLHIVSKYSISKLSSVVDIISGGTPNTTVNEYWDGDIPWLSVADFNTNTRYVSETQKHITKAGLDNSNANLLKPDTVVISARGTVGAVTQISVPMAFNQSCYGLDGRNKKKILNGYLYYYLFSERNYIEKHASGMKFPSIVRSTFDSIEIPIPDIEIQKKIIKECEKIDSKYESTRMSIEEYRKKIEDLFNELDVISYRGGYRLSLADNAKFDISIGKRVLNKQLSPDAETPVYSANVKEPFGYIDDLLITDFSVPSVLWGIDGDWMTSYMPENEKFYPTDHCGVLRCKTADVSPRYLAHVLEREGRKIGFSRSYRASIDRIQSITFFVADRNVQDATVDQITKIESKILESEATLKELNDKTSEVLHRYLD